jgi:hypothetical protein
MSDASDKLSQSRRAILEYVHRRERHHDPHEEAQSPEWPRERPEEPPPRSGGWLGRVQHALRTWWRYHPAHMAVEVATPVLSAYARQKPAQVLGFAALAGAALVFARPWRLISLTTLLVAVLKSSHLPGVLLSALSAADFEKDHRRPE